MDQEVQANCASTHTTAKCSGGNNAQDNEDGFSSKIEASRDTRGVVDNTNTSAVDGQSIIYNSANLNESCLSPCARGGSSHVSVAVNEETAEEVPLLAKGSSTIQQVEIGVSSRRWAILVLFSLTLLVNQAQYCSFATINKETMEYFDTTNLGATMLTAVYSAVYIVLIIPMCIFYDKLGFYNGMLLTGVCNVLCGAFKLVGAFFPYYGIVLTGQLFGGLSQLFSLSIPPLLAAIWFPTAERSLATSVGTLSGFLGIAYSFYFSPLIINGSPDKEHFARLLGSEFGAAALCFLMCLVVVKDRPPKPPSATARVKSGLPSAPRECLRLFATQFKNFSLVRLWLAFGLANGTVTALSTVLSSMLLPHGISEGRTGAIVSCAIVGGCITAPIVALRLDKTRNYKSSLAGLYGFAFLAISGTATAIALEADALYTLCFVLIVLSQMALLPSIPVAMEFSVEKSYPIPEVVASSLCLVHLCVFAVGGSVLFSSLLGDDPSKDEGSICMWICVGVIFVALLLVATVREDRFRFHHEREVTAAGVSAKDTA